MSENSRLTIKFAKDAQDERALVENGTCDFAISDRSGKTASQPEDFLLYVTTRLEHVSLTELPGWTLLLNSGPGGIKRFGLLLSRNAFMDQLAVIFPNKKVLCVI